ncbi:MAG: phosphatidate cytidylyltransferase [Actinomycetota bacterium]
MERSDVRSKVLGGVALGGVALACLFWSRFTVLVLLLVLALIAGGELFRLARARGARPVPLAGLAGIAGAYVIAYREGTAAPEDYPVLIAATLVVTAAAVLVRRDRDGALVSIASTVFVVVYVGVMGSYMLAMRGGPDGFRIVLVFGLMVVLNDAGSWAVGRSLGRRALAPQISPSKTWEGALGGALFTLVVGLLAGLGLDPPFTLGRGLVLAGLVVFAAPLGDLFESMLKRDFGVKDAGAVIPQHGGALDRLDSLLFVAPLFFYAYRAVAA